MKYVEKSSMRTFLLAIFLFSSSFTQQLNQENQLIDNLRDIVEVASRAGKDVFVEDFTGLE